MERTRSRIVQILIAVAAVVMVMLLMPGSVKAENVKSLSSSTIGGYRDNAGNYYLAPGSYRLDGNLTISGTVFAKSNNVTLDLNGYALKSSGYTLYLQGSYVTLKDSSQRQTGTIDSIFNMNGTLYLTGGTVGTINNQKQGVIYADGGTVTSTVYNDGTISRRKSATDATTFLGDIMVYSGFSGYSGAMITVTFDTQGGSTVTSLTGLKGKLTMPSDPTKADNEGRFDYTFDGWWTAASGGTRVDDLNTLKGNTTIYAHWIQTVKESYLKSLEQQISNPDVKFRVSDTGHWQLSYDNGTTWTDVLGTDNNPVPATGSTGETGVSITKIEKTATVDLMDTYTITFSNGTTSTFIVTHGAKGDTGDKGDKGDPGVSVTSIDKTGTEGLVDTYTITLSNGNKSTFTVTNGAKGDTGATGATGEDGVSVSKVEKTGSSGLVDTYTITLSNGTTSTFTVANGAAGATGAKGDKGDTGAAGITPKIKIGDDLYWYVSYDNGDTWTSLGVKAVSETNTVVAFFNDVTDSDYFFDSVYWAASKSITSGKGNNLYDPTGDVTRQEFVTFLWRLAGKPKPTTTATFSDMNSVATWAKDAVSWASEKGYLAGIDGRADPTGIITREQAATILYRYYGSPEVSDDSAFSDVESSKWYTTAINWGSQKGIIAGYGNGEFGLGDKCNRAQAITFIYRAEH